MTPRPPLSSDRAARRFIVAFFSIFIAGLALTIALNLVADPFRVFGTTRWRGVNDRSPETVGFDRMTKPYEILHRQAHTVIFGSSTAHTGFLTLASWDVTLPKPAYNYSLLGASAHEIRLSLEQALRESPAEAVVMIADFFSYNANYADNTRFLPERLEVASHERWRRFTLEDLGAFTLGIDTTKLSWQTLRASRSALPEAPAAASAATEKSEGPLRVHFRNCEHSYLEKWFPSPARRYEFIDAKHRRDSLADFDAVLRACHARGVHLYVIIPPVHARFQEAIATAGLWDEYETWKRALLSQTKAELSRTIDGKKPAEIELWDFSLFNERTCEPVPVAGPGLAWWHDSTHFTAEFGRAMLDRILRTSPDEASALGVRLAPGSIDFDAHLSTLRAGLESFRNREPSVVADVRDALGIAQPQRSALATDPSPAVPAAR